MNNDLISQRAALRDELNSISRAKAERDSAPQREAARAEQLKQQLAELDRQEAEAKLERLIAQNNTIMNVYKQATADLFNSLAPIVEALNAVNTDMLEQIVDEQQTLIAAALEVALSSASDGVDAHRIASATIGRFTPALPADLLLKSWVKDAISEGVRHQYRSAIALGVIGILFEPTAGYNVVQEWRSRLMNDLLIL